MTVGIRHLQVFLAIAQEGTLTAAAQVLGVSQPSVSRSLRQLEQHLSTQLVDRSTHHLRLTSDGEEYRLRAAAAVQALDAALAPDIPSGRPIRVGHSWAAFGRRTAALLAQWRAANPDNPIELHRIDQRLAGLESGAVDAAILRDLDPDLPLSRIWIGREHRVAALPANHSLAGRTSLALDDLVDQTVVLNPTSGTTTLDLWPRARPLKWIEVHNTDDWLFAITGGAGVGVTSHATTATLTGPDVVYLPITDAPAITVELAWTRPPTHPLTESLGHYCAKVAGSG